MYIYTSDAASGPAFDNPVYGSTAAGGKNEQAPQWVDSQSPSPSASFDNPIYGILEATHQPQLKPHQGHVYTNLPNVPMHNNVGYQQQLPLNKSNGFYSNMEFHHPNSPPDVEFQNVLYEPTNTAVT